MEAALKTTEGTFTVEQVETPELPGPDWVRARVKVAGICGTDLRHWKKHEPELEHHIMGHELSGVVEEVGPDVTNVRPGDRVVIETLLGDGTCEWCLSKQYNLCPELYPVRMETVSRAFATQIIAPWDKFYKLPDNVGFEEATLLDTFAVCLHAMHLSDIHVNDKVVVIGAGPIGLGQLQLAKIAGADVIVTDVVDSSLALARELGADMVVNSRTDDAAAKVKAFTGGRGVDIVFECCGGPSMPRTLPQAVSFVRIGGKVVIVGGFDPGPVSIPLEWQHIQMAEIKLIPSASYAFRDIYPEMQTVLDLVANGKLNAKKLITHSFPLEKINEGFETAQKKDETHAVFVALTMPDQA